MTSNPYAVPEGDFEKKVDTSPEREKLRRVAKHQRLVIVAVLCNLAVNAAVVFARDPGLPGGLILLGIVGVVVVFQLVAIFLLANEVYGTGIAIFCSLLMFLPCISLITLLVINQKAIALLQGGGIKVGFFGVDPKTI